jgi:Zn-dependent M28 family amino/carboxypeptidase
MAEQNINVDYIRRHVSMLAGSIGERNIDHSRALHRAADYITDQWRAMGYEVQPQHFMAKGIECSNLEVTRAGDKHPDRIVLLGAHYDSSSGCPGANDNASGIAALLEVSRTLRQMQLKCSLRFVAFANQAPPFFGTEEMGSWVYTHHARQRGDDIRAAVILETLGYYSDAPASQLAPAPLSLVCPSRGNFVAMVSNLRSMGVSRRFTRAFRHHSSFPCQQVSAPQILPGIAASDQSPFWLNGYKAFVITDTARYRYPFYHSAKDTPDKIDCNSIGAVSDGIVKALLELDEQC